MVFAMRPMASRFICAVTHRVSIKRDAIHFKNLHQPMGINETERIPTGVGVRVQPALQPDRITLNVPPEPGAVRPPPVLIEASLRIVVLPRQPQVLRDE